MFGADLQPHSFEVLETLAKGSVVGTGINLSVTDQDTVRNPLYFYIDSETGELLV